MNHLELFSGIGGFRRALDLLQSDNVMDFHCIGFSEVDEKALITYQTNFSVSPQEVKIGDIVAFTSVSERISKLPDFELLTGGFPCQPFSMMGRKAGFEEDRGQMFFRIMDIVRIKKPRYILLENVKNLYTHDKGNTYKTIKKVLEEEGYSVISGIFNTADFHLPQTRNRVIIFATLDTLSDDQRDAFISERIKQLFDLYYKTSSVASYSSTLDILQNEVQNKYFLSERIKPTILSNGSSGFKSNSEINLTIARPLTATMHKMHRACQDNYYSKEFIDSQGKDNPAKYCTKDELAKRDIRKLTPEEAFMLQGFPMEYATNARLSGVSDGALYKQAGNAVSVNTIYAIMLFLITNHYIIEP